MHNYTLSSVRYLTSWSKYFISRQSPAWYASTVSHVWWATCPAGSNWALCIQGFVNAPCLMAILNILYKWRWLSVRVYVDGTGFFSFSLRVAEEAATRTALTTFVVNYAHPGLVWGCHLLVVQCVCVSVCTHARHIRLTNPLLGLFLSSAEWSACVEPPLKLACVSGSRVSIYLAVRTSPTGSWWLTFHFHKGAPFLAVFVSLVRQLLVVFFFT